jgi:hypothetical protein
MLFFWFSMIPGKYGLTWEEKFFFSVSSCIPFAIRGPVKRSGYWRITVTTSDKP